MASFVQSVAHEIILISDWIGFEVHFIRFLYWTMFDSTYDNEIQTVFTTDILLIAFILIPLYLLAMHFLLHPID